MRFMLIILMMFGPVGAAWARIAHNVGKHGAWAVYATTDTGTNLCWIITAAKFINGVEPEIPVHLMISTGRTKDATDLSVTSEDPEVLAAGSFAIRFDVVDLQMTKRAGWLWMRDREANSQIIELLFARSGPDNTIYVQSSRHVIEFPSDGMQQALQDMISHCPQD